MSVTNPLFPIVAVLIVFITLRFFPKNFTPQMSPKRFNSIDGLRGYLAFSVYLHHSIVWYFYLQDEIWQAPPTRLFRHLGEASVAVFFMITSFLFLTKLDQPQFLQARHCSLVLLRFLKCFLMLLLKKMEAQLVYLF